MIIIAYICSCVLCYFLALRGWNNKFGWGERALLMTWSKYLPPLLISICGPIGIVVVLLTFRRLCFVSKKRGLELDDAKDFEEWGYCVGRKIAEKEGRVPTNNSTE